LNSLPIFKTRHSAQTFDTKDIQLTFAKINLLLKHPENIFS